jgi:hypothetical protein
MYEYFWKFLAWPFSTIIGGLTAFDAFRWLNDDPPDRIMTGIVCGFVAGVIWLMLILTVRRVAER